jgi:signal transduction histidine kinase/CheY-like chemotaxis protein
VSERVQPSLAADLFRGDDPTSAAHRDHDWTTSPLGPVEGWSDELRAAIRTVVPSRVPMLLWWGPDLVQVYNEPYSALMGDKHPGGVGQPAAECWAEAWDDLAPLVAQARAGQATHSQDLPLLLRRHGFDEETSWTFSFSPVCDVHGAVHGLFVATTETTEAGVRGVRLAVLSALGAISRSSAPSVTAVLDRAVAALAGCPGEVRFAVARARIDDGPLSVAAAGGLTGPDAAEPPGDPALLARVLADGEAEREEAGPAGWPGTPAPGPGRAPTRSALHLPIVDRGQDRTIGVLTVGLNPHRPDDEDYRAFLELVARHVSTAVTDTLAHTAEKRRTAALADLDRAKTRFLQTTSHELRTPLTLLINATEALLVTPGLDEQQRRDAEVAERATLRLRRLVDGLLDVGRAEEGRLEASPVPVDLAAVTADVASMFRSAIESAGMGFEVRIADLPEPIEVDPEMWTRIVSNLLSNAYKFTPEGTITLVLERCDDTVALVVTDTGIGIPAGEQPRLFRRFHQVPGTSARTADGAGIGLALVRDLAVALGGGVAVESTPGEGSRFTVTIPHRASAEPAADVSDAVRYRTRPLAVEASTWASSPGPAAPRSDRDDDRILVVEDNPDMRDHVARLLEADGWPVDAVGDVATALAHPRPLLVVSDVMLPGADGIDLVHALRADPERADVPVVLLTARAGPEAAADGFAAGATDYLAKPFAPTELQARVRTHAEAHRRRREALAEAGGRADHLEVALRSSRRIGAAIGIIMERARIPEDEAFALLRKASQDGNRKLRDVAEQIVLTGTVPPG